MGVGGGTDELASPLKGMTTSAQKHPRVCLGSHNLERDPPGGHLTDTKPVLTAPFGAIIGTNTAELCILRQQIMFCSDEECVISKGSCERGNYAKSPPGFFEIL